MDKFLFNVLGRLGCYFETVRASNYPLHVKEEAFLFDDIGAYFLSLLVPYLVEKETIVFPPLLDFYNGVQVLF